MGEQLLLSDAQVGKYLHSRGVIESPGQDVAVSRAGDGNINWVRRATIQEPERRSWIVKQARPALEAFPEYQAPIERLMFEHRWFQQAVAVDEDGCCPRIHDFDADHAVLVMEDLGDAERLDEALARDCAGREFAPAIRLLSGLLGRLHGKTLGDPALAQDFQNEPMQRLHGDHIFTLPYTEEFPCPPATAARAAEIRADERLRAIAARAYERYLTPRGSLVHADVQPGNVLLVQRDGRTIPKLLDAEIAHVGDPAFDIGVLMAHLALPAIAAGRASEARPLLADVLVPYAMAFASQAGGSTADGAPSTAEMTRYAGLELVRRTIGAARVPAVESDPAGLRVLETGIGWMRDPEREMRLDDPA